MPPANRIAVGEVHGLWEVVEVLPKQAGMKWQVAAVCRGCGARKTLDYSSVKNGYSSRCRQCASLVGSASARWTGHGAVPGALFTHYTQHAADREIPFTLTIQDLSDLYEKQGRACALTGVLLSMPSPGDSGTASLDRVDSDGGYVPGNVQWVHKIVNLMKGTLSNLDFIEACAAVTRHMTESSRGSSSWTRQKCFQRRLRSA